MSSLSCNEGSGMHGMPPALTSHQCPAGVLNCVRILASKSVHDYWIANANSPQTRRATTPRCWAGAVDWRWAGPGVCKVMIDGVSSTKLVTTFQDCLTGLFSTLARTSAPSPRASAAPSFVTLSTGVTAARWTPPPPSCLPWPSPPPWFQPWSAWPSQ